MNRVFRAGLHSAVATLALAAGRGPAWPDDPPAKGPAELQGCWKFESIEIDGKADDPIGGGQPRWVVRGDKVFYGGDEVMQLTADPSTSPKVIDLKFRGPERVYEGIYVVEKDTLRVCLNGRGDAKDRPDAFATKDHTDRRLLVFKKEKAAPANPTEGLPAFAGIQLRSDADNAVVVDAPIKGSPAEKAGLKRGDVILKVGGAAVTDLDATVKAVRQAKPGAKLEFQIRRDGKERAVTVTVGVFPLPFTAMLE
jgi:uncharacterized protein (TIGR03067 family)